MQVCFGPMVPSVVITAMKGASVVAAVKLLLCLNLLCTFPIIVRGAFQVRAFAQASESQYNTPAYGHAPGVQGPTRLDRLGSSRWRVGDVCMLGRIGVPTCPSVCRYGYGRASIERGNPNSKH